MKLYHSPGACSLAPHIALEETGARYEPALVKLADGAQRKPEYLAVNPEGRVPAIADNGFVVTESPAVRDAVRGVRVGLVRRADLLGCGPVHLHLVDLGAGPNLGFDMGRESPAWTAHARRMGERPAVRRALARKGIALP